MYIQNFKYPKNYPIIGYITSKANLTINIIPPLSIGETFIAFWNACGDAIALVGARALGAFATFVMDQL